MGRLTRDPDVRMAQTADPYPIATYTLAVDRRGTNADGQREADFIRCVAFKRQAEFAEKWLHQGIKIAVTGHIQTGSYTNQEGQKVYTTDVIIEEQEFAESKAASEGRQSYGGQQSYGYQQNGGYSTQAQSQGARVSYGSDGFMDGFENIPSNLDDAGLPFN